MRAPFTLSQFCPGGISHSGKPTSLPGIAKELLPAGALRSNVVGTYGSPTNAPSQNAVQGFVIGSACAAAFFHRGIIPLLTLFFSASGSQKTAVTPLEEGRQMPSGLPPPAGGSVSPTGRKFLQIRAARHTATIHSSLFSIHWSRQGGISHPGKPTLLPGNARELLPAGASLFHGDMIK